MLEGEVQTEASPEEVAAEEAKMRAQQGRARRQGFAGERMSNEKVQGYKKPIYPKDDMTKARIRRTLKEDDRMQVLFGHLDGEPLNDVINAFFTKQVRQGEDIIKQGDDGDCLYIISDGSVDIFVARPGPDGVMVPGDRGAQVAAWGSGALFGELALMYNSPRAATVTAASDVVLLWVLAAADFKMLLAQSSQAQYAKYEGWLSEVELLKTLNHFELSKLADVLENHCFAGGEDIILQGESGDRFFILEDGQAAAFLSGTDGEKMVMSYERQGDYFGEIALLTAEPRKATVRAMGEGCSVVSLSKDDFTCILGPIADILKEHLDKYPQYADFLRSEAL
mmetsp:Transcript_70914/g.163951  ORF Transcript_70914/g.163951 Transcript_70914/m.163951 type:complete len:338 (-) Transcript_70914:92-1105(-)|eukprot:CAMPEP_0171069840 /NCGR_PEP_ID=MMETSP0766_2-20121228/9392_1 /TAXON_ID=439317 /ORGANISM="Gambierdiscus australes, Strain CAWD 149" /LENGTH=337 /DNA_ID=CAMNT_0011526257 /DNA_START=82 /DNA_END=1095 /DNA_ORIENTATION=+